jgi:transcriptional regulator with XRE-family HTH domain
MTAAQIATEIGINRRTYTFYQAGRMPHLTYLRRMSDRFNVPISWLRGD